MSYCVECGVKLADSEKVCPLCNTEVINPNRKGEGDQRPYPKRVEHQMTGINRVSAAQLGSVFLICPVGASLLIDFLTARWSVSWSLYVAGAGMLLFIMLLLPMMFKQSRPYLSLVLDTISVGAYLMIIAWVGGDMTWCWLFGLPIVTLTGFAAAAILAFCRAKKMKLSSKVGGCSIVLSFYILLLELSIDRAIAGKLFFWTYSPSDFYFNWSQYVVAPLLFISILCFYVSRKAGLIDEIKRRLFV